MSIHAITWRHLLLKCVVLRGNIRLGEASNCCSMLIGWMNDQAGAGGEWT